MDQKEIDELLKAGSFSDFNQKQDELIQHISEKNSADAAPSPPASPSPPAEPTPPPQTDGLPDGKPPVPPKKEGRVMGQLSRVTEESEAGTNMVMEYMEIVLNTVSKQKEFITDIRNKFNENPDAINVNEALTFVNDSLSLIEGKIFDAMDAFQFQDIGRQKLMKVMYTLARLNEYLNELLGGPEESDRTKTFGKKIEQKTMAQDKDKDSVDSIVAGFQKEEKKPGPPAEQARPKPPPPPGTSTGSGSDAAVDVDQIVAEFQKQNK